MGRRSPQQGGHTITDSQSGTSGAGQPDPAAGSRHGPIPEWAGAFGLWAAGRRILWVGADRTLVPYVMAALGAEVTVVDDRAGLLADAAQRVSRAGMAFDLASPAALPHPAAHFDAVVVARPQDAEPGAKAEYARVLAPGGRLVWLGASPADPAAGGWTHRTDGGAGADTWTVMTEVPAEPPVWPPAPSAPQSALDQLAAQLAASLEAAAGFQREAERLARDNATLAAAAVRVRQLEEERQRWADTVRTLKGAARRVDEAVARAAAAEAENAAVRAESRAVWAEHEALAARSERLAAIEASRAWALTARYWHALDHSPARGVLKVARRLVLLAAKRPPDPK